MAFTYLEFSHRDLIVKYATAEEAKEKAELIKKMAVGGKKLSTRLVEPAKFDPRRYSNFITYIVYISSIFLSCAFLKSDLF